MLKWVIVVSYFKLECTIVASYFKIYKLTRGGSYFNNIRVGAEVTSQKSRTEASCPTSRF